MCPSWVTLASWRHVWSCEGSDRDIGSSRGTVDAAYMLWEWHGIAVELRLEIDYKEGKAAGYWVQSYDLISFPRVDVAQKLNP